MEVNKLKEKNASFKLFQLILGNFHWKSLESSLLIFGFREQKLKNVNGVSLESSQEGHFMR